MSSSLVLGSLALGAVFFGSLLGCSSSAEDTRWHGTAPGVDRGDDTPPVPQETLDAIEAQRHTHAVLAAPCETKGTGEWCAVNETEFAFQGACGPGRSDLGVSRLECQPQSTLAPLR